MLLRRRHFRLKLLVDVDDPLHGEDCKPLLDLLLQITIRLTGDRGGDFSKEVRLSKLGDPALADRLKLQL